MSLTSKLFGRRLRQMRKDRGYTRAREFAELIGTEENTLTRWERGETEPSLEILLRICQVLGTSPNELLLGPHHRPRSAPKPKPDQPRPTPSNR